MAKQSHRVIANESPIPRRLFAWRSVTHYSNNPENHCTCSPTGTKYVRSLEHQAAHSLALLQERLEAEGQRYRIALERQDFPKPRWNVFANGTLIAEFDENWGYDRFDESADSLAEAIRAIIEDSGVKPLSDEEARFLELHEMATRITAVRAVR